MTMNGSSPLRFQFYTGPYDASRQSYEIYHRDLIDAELLLERAVRAKADGVRPIHAALTAHVISDGLERPQRASLAHAPTSPEYVRWFDADGASRLRPLTREDLTQSLVLSVGISVAAATHLVGMHSHALTESDHQWLEARIEAAPDRRPLDGSEYLQLVQSLEGAYQGSIGSSQVKDNAAIAMTAAGVLGSLHDSYQPSPFDSAELSRAYRAAHASHLQSIADMARGVEEHCRQRAPESPETEWAKSDRKNAEFSLAQADRAVSGIAPVPTALTVSLATSDGREIWWSVMAKDPDGVVNSAVCEAVINLSEYEKTTGIGETTRFAIEVHFDDGVTTAQFEGTGDMWRDIEAEGGKDELYRCLLAGGGLGDEAPEPTMNTLACG